MEIGGCYINGKREIIFWLSKKQAKKEKKITVCVLFFLIILEHLHDNISRLRLSISSLSLILCLYSFSYLHRIFVTVLEEEPESRISRDNGCAACCMSCT